MNETVEFEYYKKQIKDNITSYINNNQIKDAINLISEYEMIVTNDIEVYSFKAIISIVENNFEKAESLLKEGLQIEPSNVDLLFNIAYLFESQGNQKVAIEYYKKALQSARDIETEEAIKEILYKLGVEETSVLFKPNTSIIILTFNNLEYNKVCLDSIRKYTLKNTYEIIVIDNNSTDGTVEWLKEQRDIRVIFNKENVGFPKGCNQGIKIANINNDILLLNNDVIVTPNWLENLQKSLYSDSNIGAVGAVTNNCSNNQVINGNYNNIDQLIDFSKGNNISDSSKWVEKLRLIGFCMLIKRNVINKVGLLDEIFTPGNFEDDDYSYRIRQAGYKLLLCKDAYIHHFGSASFNKAPDEYNQLLQVNREKFKNKWGFDPVSMNNKEVSAFSNLKDVLENNQDNITFTGERLVINNEVKEKYNDVLEEHIERYKLARKFVKEQKVLDAACGAGYGTKMLELAGAANVTGIDISEESLKNARETYFGENITFEYGDVNQLLIPDESFDVVVSFETIEHIDNGPKWIEESSRILKDGGVFIVSTPNRDVTNPGSYYEEQPLNTFHKYEYNTQEFIGELLKKYDIIELYGQTFINDKDIPYVNIMRQLRKKDIDYIPKMSNKVIGHELIPLGNIKDSQPMYLVAVCRKKLNISNSLLQVTDVNKSNNLKELKSSYHDAIKNKFFRFGENSIIFGDFEINNFESISIGENVLIKKNCWLNVVYKHRNGEPSIIIEDGCQIGKGFTISVANKAIIKKNVIVGPNVYIADCGHEYKNTTIPIMNQGVTSVTNEVVVGENSWLGINTVMVGNVHIGKNCVIGANSFVNRDIPDYSVAVGNPAKLIKVYDIESEKWVNITSENQLETLLKKRIKVHQ